MISFNGCNKLARSNLVLHIIKNKYERERALQTKIHKHAFCVNKQYIMRIKSISYDKFDKKRLALAGDTMKKRIN